MSAIITTKARIHDANSFIQSLGSTNPGFINSIYLFIGHTLPWTTDDGPTASDNVPPFPSDTVTGHINVWKNIIHLKKLSQSDCSLVIKRYDWVKNTVYTQYSQDIDLFDPTLGLTPFYILTDDLNVYKCLYNFKNGPSFVKPTGTSTNIITTGDGYQWKFMFTVSTTDAEKFLTNEWIPVKTLVVSDNSKQWDVQQNAIDGSIDVINILNEGFGYTTIPTVTITGDGINAAAVVQISSGQISNITITNRGTGYTFANVIVPGGQVTSIVISNGGSGYVSPPSVVISGVGSGATAHAVLTGGVVTSIVIDSQGNNYTSAPTVTIGASPGVTATANAIVSGGVVFSAEIAPPGGHGSNPVAELGGFFAILNGKFNFDENGKFSVSNDFRTLGLLLNPTTTANVPGTALLYTQAWSLTLKSVTGVFSPDDLIQGSVSSATGVVLDYNSTTKVLRVVNSQGTFDAGEIIATLNNSKSGTLETVNGTAQGAGTLQIQLAAGDPASDNDYAGSTIRITGGPGNGQQKLIVSNVASTKEVTINSGWGIQPTSASTYSIAKIGYPELKKNSGSILYIENRKPLLRANLQIESISPCIEF